MNRLNPFEDEIVAQEWIKSVEGERGLIRDNEIYPMLSNRTEMLDGNLVELGSGQGICSDKIPKFKGKYLGIEPSIPLVTRANLLYSDINRSFIVGNIYNIPLPLEFANNIFSINVWFHLQDLSKAANEIARILKIKGKFLIITANPNSYNKWEGFYENIQKKGNMMIGKVNVPVNSLSQNIFFFHSLQEISFSLQQAGFHIDEIKEFGNFKGNNLFISINGYKK